MERLLSKFLRFFEETYFWCGTKILKRLRFPEDGISRFQNFYKFPKMTIQELKSLSDERLTNLSNYINIQNVSGFNLISFDEFRIKYSLGYKVFYIEPDILVNQEVILLKTYQITPIQNIFTHIPELDFVITGSNRTFHRPGRAEIGDLIDDYLNKVLAYVRSTEIQILYT